MMKKFATIGFIAASLSVSLAQPYYLAGDWQTPATWQPAANQMTAGPGAGEYSYTITGGTAGSYANCKVTDGTWNNTWPSQNLKVLYDNTGSATVHFYPGSFNDGWLPLANRVGCDDPNNDLGWGIAGDFDGWNGTAALLPSLGNGVYSNTVSVATAGTFGFKFQSPAGSWSDIYFGSDFGNGGNNGSYTTTNSPQQVPVALDLPNGRYLIGGLAPQPVTNTVVFAVDMTYQIQLGLFTPGSSVFVAGDFNGWPGTGVNALPLQNLPAFQGGNNTNIYYGTNVFVGLPNSAVSQYKFTQNDPKAQNSGWETSNNRTVTMLPTNGTNNLPVVVFSDLYPADALTAPAVVTFSVDMANAVGTDSHQFNPIVDNVYLNGAFVGWYPWAGGSNPSPAPAGFQMVEVGTSTIYTNTITLPAGTPFYFQYKYGMDPGGANGGPNDDEAGIGLNHTRVVRSTAMGTYVLPTDTFGYMYGEPYFTGTSLSGGNLNIGAPSGGKVPVSWLGRPGAHLQVNTSLNGAAWQDLSGTDGTSWTAGYNSTNGLVSVTNWPAGGNAFFRLVKP